VVNAALAEVQRGLEQLEKKAQQFKTCVTQDYRILDELVSGIAKAQKELGSVEKSLKSKGKDSKDNASLKSTKSGLNRLKQQFTPETGSLFVRLFLGQVNVKMYRDGERFRLKQEYETFKRKTNPQFILFAVLLYFFPHPMLITAWQVWLLYYYVTLALRENILKVNGSSIKRWWIVHHYLSMIGSLIMLLWPLGPAFHHFLPKTLHFSVAQGLVQGLTNRYQQGQLYKLVAMGKANIMDVAGESEGWIDYPGWTPSAMFLFPFLLAVQLFQLYHGADLFYSAYLNSFKEWQVAGSGVVFLLLACGNLSTTIATYYQKWTGKPKGE